MKKGRFLWERKKNPYALKFIDRTRIAGAFSHGRIIIFKIATAGVLAKLHHKDGIWIRILDLLLINGLLASYSTDGTIKLWDIDKKTCIATFDKQFLGAYDSGIRHYLHKIDDTTLLAIGDTTIVWDIARKTPLKQFQKIGWPFNSALLNGHLVLLLSYKCLLLDLSSGNVFECKEEEPFNAGTLDQVAILDHNHFPESRRMLVHGGYCILEILDLPTFDRVVAARIAKEKHFLQ